MGDSEAGVSQLEQNRFVVSSESMKGIEKIKCAFQELQEDYPYLSGVGFFGSRTKGTEDAGSDYDICVFYNSDRMDINMRDKEDWTDIISRLEKSVAPGLDRRIQIPSGGQRVDLSEKRTLSKIGMFVRAAEPFVGQESDSDKLLRSIDIPPTQNLYSRFFMAVGNEVQGSREFVLDELEKMEKGERYFQILIRALANFERGNASDKVSTPQYKGYPQTIKDARDYFNLI